MPRRSERFGSLLMEAIGGLTLREVARRSDVSYTAVGNWAKGEIPTDPDYIRALAKSLNAPLSPLLESAGYLPTEEDKAWDRERFPVGEARSDSPSAEMESDSLMRILSQFGKVRRRPRRPLLGTVPAGLPEHREPVFKEARETPFDYDLVVEGDSMSPVIKHGTTVIVRTDVPPKDRDFVVATVNGENTLKQLISTHHNGEKIYTLKALNDGYEDIREGDITIQGIVERVEVSAREFADLQQENEILKRRIEDLLRATHEGEE
jgi:SOS-response transcriptional repressor LexA